MKFANIRETKAKLSKYLKIASQGEAVIVTFQGKPYAVIKKLSEEDVEDFVLSNHPKLKKELQYAYKEAKQGKGKTIEKLAKELGIEL